MKVKMYLTILRYKTFSLSNKDIQVFLFRLSVGSSSSSRSHHSDHKYSYDQVKTNFHENVDYIVVSLSSKIIKTSRFLWASKSLLNFRFLWAATSTSRWSCHQRGSSPRPQRCFFHQALLMLFHQTLLMLFRQTLLMFFNQTLLLLYNQFTKHFAISLSVQLVSGWRHLWSKRSHLWFTPRRCLWFFSCLCWCLWCLWFPPRRCLWSLWSPISSKAHQWGHPWGICYLWWRYPIYPYSLTYTLTMYIF